MHSIWAVATNTIKQVLRLKIAAVFIILLIVLLPVMGISTTGDYTLKGRLQTFVSYSLSLTNLLLCLLAIIISIYTVTNDIKQRQIYTVVTKPIHRYQLLLGKLLGVILINAALLALFSAVIYAITIYTPKFLNPTQDEIIEAKNQFFTARASLTPAEVDVTQEVIDTYEQLKKTGQLPLELSENEIKKELTRRKLLEKRAAVVGQRLIWQFNNVKPIDPKASIFIRYKYDVPVEPPDSKVHSRWDVGDNRHYPPTYESYLRSDTIRTFRELEVPAYLVAEDNFLVVSFLNIPWNNTTVIFPPDGLEVLYKADTFTANFVRVVLLIMIRLIFLACLGILASTFLSFPVAILLSLCVFFAATFSGFCLESFDYLGEDLSWIYSYTVRPIILLLPQFDKFNPSKFLVPARLLSWFLLARVAGIMICIKAVLLLLIALLIFTFREIAKIII